MWELDYKESWVPKNWCFCTVVLEKTLQNPMDCKEIQPVNPKGNQSWIFIGRTDAEAEIPILWLTVMKNWLIWKDPDAGKDWRQEEKGTIEDEMVEWHHWLNGHEFEQAPGVGDGQGSLACCSPWGRKELNMTEWLNWTEIILEGREGTSCTMTNILQFSPFEKTSLWRGKYGHRYTPKKAMWWWRQRLGGTSAIHPASKPPTARKEAGADLLTILRRKHLACIFISWTSGL